MKWDPPKQKITVSEPMKVPNKIYHLMGYISDTSLQIVGCEILGTYIDCQRA